IYLPGEVPGNRAAGHRSRHGDAVVNAGFKLGAFFVVVPGHKLDTEQLVSSGVVLSRLGNRLQPGLPALLRREPVRGPGGDGVVESLVTGSGHVLADQRLRRGVKTVEV